MATKNKTKKNKGGGGVKKERKELPEPRMQVGIVRAVISGDTVSILEIEDSSRPKEILFTLLRLKAPQLGRRTPDGKITKDDPFAWQSREFLRKLVIGQPVVYRQEHCADPMGRHYGELWISKDGEDIDLRLYIVASGWADVTPPKPKERKGKEIELTPTQSHLYLESMRDEAKKKQKGIWNPNHKSAIRNIKYHEIYRDQKTDALMTDELFDFYKKVKDKGPLPAIVESVKTGTTLNILLPEEMDYFSLSLTGVRSPGFKEEAEPFAKEAKFFTEHNLLHRDVKVTIEGMDKHNLYGTVNIGDCQNISLNLLTMGLASFVEWSARFSRSTELVEEFQRAEKEARDNGFRMWSNYQPLISASNPHKVKHKGGKDSGKFTKDKSFTELFGKVIEIVNAGTLAVRVTKADTKNPNKTIDRIISFSSIRPPRTIRINEEEKKQKDTKPLTPEQQEKKEEEEKKLKEENEELKREAAYAIEAKEFLRNLLIGQKVRCVFDYPRGLSSSDKGTAPPVKLYWSVYYTEGNSEKNVAVELVNHGYARVVNHVEDEPRSADFKDLILAEKAAKNAHRGLHSSVSRKPVHHITDLIPPPQSKDKSDKKLDNKRKAIAAKCQQFVVYLQRNQQKLDAIVDYVFAGGRFKLSIPSQSCVIMFSLQGCIIEKPEKSSVNIPNKPDISTFDKQYPPTLNYPGNLALHFSRDHIYQRKVQVTVVSVDKHGNFWGHLYLNNKDFALALIENGHAKLSKGIAQKWPNFEAFKNAEKNAMDKRIGIWGIPGYDKKKDKEVENITTEPVEREVYPITVTDIRSGSRFSYQILNDETGALTDLSNSLRTEKFSEQPSYDNPSRYELVAAQYSIDDQWYRGQILSISNGKFDVRYIDYGNREILGSDRIRPLPTEYKDLIKPQANDGKLVWIKPPDLESEFGREAAGKFRSLVWDRVLNAEEVYTEKIPSKDQETHYLHYLILTDENKVDINSEIVANGLARVEKRWDQDAEDDMQYKSLLAAQERARTNRLNLWEYGDYPDSDEDREGK